MGDRGRFIHEEGNRRSWSLMEADTKGMTGLRSARSLDTSSAEQAGMRGGGRSGLSWAGADDGRGTGLADGGDKLALGGLFLELLLDTLDRFTATSCTGDSVTDTLEPVAEVVLTLAPRPLKKRDDLLGLLGDGVALFGVEESLLPPPPPLLLLFLLVALVTLTLVLHHVLAGCLGDLQPDGVDPVSLALDSGGGGHDVDVTNVMDTDVHVDVVTVGSWGISSSITAGVEVDVDMELDVDMEVEVGVEVDVGVGVGVPTGVGEDAVKGVAGTAVVTGVGAVEAGGAGPCAGADGEEGGEGGGGVRVRVKVGLKVGVEVGAGVGVGVGVDVGVGADAAEAGVGLVEAGSGEGAVGGDGGLVTQVSFSGLLQLTMVDSSVLTAAPASETLMTPFSLISRWISFIGCSSSIGVSHSTLAGSSVA